MEMCLDGELTLMGVMDKGVMEKEKEKECVYGLFLACFWAEEGG